MFSRSVPLFVLGLTLCLGHAASALTVMTYNLSGNGATDWSTNAAQVQAIGRQMMYLQPDIITFNEVPNGYYYEMTNFVKTYLPGYHLATNSVGDGYILSAIASRYPITRSTSYLHGSSLSAFGSSSTFTRDLFEAQISIPGSAQPFHVFTSHLKCCTDSTSLKRRAGEAGAISNFFYKGFLTTNSSHPYTLSGDLNEDINRPPSGSAHPIERLVNAATGLQLTTPVNPYNGDDRTISIQSSMTARFDYILPCSLLSTSITSSQVFRTDLLANPPPPLLAGDDRTASDHLPVLVTFDFPKAAPVYAPGIVEAPSNQAFCSGTAASFSCIATGTPPLSYEWRKEGVKLGGVTTNTPNTLVFNPVRAIDAGYYEVVVTNARGAVTSSVAVLTVQTAPAITNPPTDLAVGSGDPVAFSVGVSGTAPLSYQWRKDGLVLSSATSSAYSLGHATTNDMGVYDVVVANDCGSVTSAVATLTVNVAPFIAQPPQNQTVVAGVAVTLTVAATGTEPLEYRWQFNGSEITTATSERLVLESVATNQAGAYAVVVSNMAGVVTSEVAQLQVYPTAAATLSLPASVSNGFQFVVTGVPGHLYGVQASTDLAHWVSLATNVSAFTFTDTNANVYTNRFYRAVYSEP